MANATLYETEFYFMQKVYHNFKIQTAFIHFVDGDTKICLSRNLFDVGN